MDKTEVRNIIEATLRSGSKNPGLFDLPKVIKLKSALESCDSIDEVVDVLEASRVLIAKSFGLDNSAINHGVNSIKRLDKKQLAK